MRRSAGWMPQENGLMTWKDRVDLHNREMAEIRKVMRNIRKLQNQIDESQRETNQQQKAFSQSKRRRGK